MNPIDVPRPLDAETIEEILAYQAPFLIEKLLKERIVPDEAEAHALFAEVKRYLVMCQHDRSKLWSMFSLRVDEVWHQFVLFTREYTAFSRRFFGVYLPHSPSNAPVELGDLRIASPQEFADRYLELFGRPVPQVWRDDLAVTVDRRLIHYELGHLDVRVEGQRAVLVIERADHPDGHAVLLRVDRLAEPALRFIAETPTFFVRELPGPLVHAERVELCRVLVRHDLLRVAP